MSREILLGELRRKSEKRIAGIWERARQEADALRSRKQQEFDAACKVLEERMAGERESAAASILRAAGQEAMTRIDAARRDLAERLFRLAQQQLGRVREEDYDALFARLVAELPSADWEKIRVSPLDRERARQAFPEAEIIGDEAIVGGLEAESDQGGFSVVTTLGKRLEKGWLHALPTLLRKIEEKYDVRPAG